MLVNFSHPISSMTLPIAAAIASAFCCIPDTLIVSIRFDSQQWGSTRTRAWSTLVRRRLNASFHQHGVFTHFHSLLHPFHTRSPIKSVTKYLEKAIVNNSPEKLFLDIGPETESITRLFEFLKLIILYYQSILHLTIGDAKEKFAFIQKNLKIFDMNLACYKELKATLDIFISKQFYDEIPLFFYNYFSWGSEKLCTIFTKVRNSSFI
jgi:hypothetical protein